MQPLTAGLVGMSGSSVGPPKHPSSNSLRFDAAWHRPPLCRISPGARSEGSGRAPQRISERLRNARSSDMAAPVSYEARADMPVPASRITRAVLSPIHRLPTEGFKEVWRSRRSSLCVPLSRQTASPSTNGLRHIRARTLRQHLSDVFQFL